jgi:ferrous iron transport protein A
MYTSKKGLGLDAVRLSALKVKQTATITKVIA